MTDVTYLTNITDVDPTTLPKISLSEHATISRCTQLHSYSYREALVPLTTTTYFARGSYLHILQELYWRARHDKVPFVLADAGAEAITRLRDERQAVVDEPDKAAIDHLMSRYVGLHDPQDLVVTVIDGKPLIEREFFVDVGLRDMGGERVVLHGVIDLVVTSTKQLVVHEHKTAARAWSQLQMQQNQQAPLYAHVIETLTGVAPDAVQFNFFLKDKMDFRKLYPTKEHRLALVDELQKSIYLRDSGFVQRSVHWSCSACQFKELCTIEMQGRDSTNFRQVTYAVDEERKARFVEAD